MSLFIRNFIFTILQPGIVAGLVPYLISGKPDLKLQWGVNQYMAVILFTAGFLMMLKCIIDFAVKGKGTLSPLDPTKKLVASGLYKYSRNPMYLGVILILIGEALFFESTSLLIYVIAVFIAFNLFILLHEEPRLKRDFGNEYEDYKKKVRRWL